MAQKVTRLHKRGKHKKEDEEWDIEAVGKIPGATPQPHKDRYAGDGYRLVIPELTVQLELYPERFMARYSHLGVYLEMASVRLEIGSGVKLTTETDKCRTVVRMFKPEGTIIFSGPVEQPAPPAVMESPNKPDGDENNNNTIERRESPDRVTLTGNVGRDPELRTTAKGRKVLKFPLGVHEGERTNWHDVLFFDDKAEKTAGKIAKGELVTVVGYKHEREAEVKKGNTTLRKRVVEIYGALVRTPSSPNAKATK